MIVHAGTECIAARDAVHQAIGAQKLERAIGGDGCRPRLSGCQPFDDVIGAERLVAAEQERKDFPAKRGQPLTMLPAPRLRLVAPD